MIPDLSLTGFGGCSEYCFPGILSLSKWRKLYWKVSRDEVLGCLAEPIMTPKVIY